MTSDRTDGSESLQDLVEAPLRRGSLRVSGYLLIAALLGVILIGMIAWVDQLTHGLGVTGMSNGVSWGLYVANFVFFIGISMAGTVVSAVLRLVGAEWRHPITRIAEVVTASALLVAAAMIVVDMGRPDRLLNVFKFPHLRSPILWDVISLQTYLAGSIIYLYLPMIPDLARLANGSASSTRRKLYRLLSLGWDGRPEQRRRLEKATSIMTIAIIPTAVAIHTVTAWIFSMTLREGWNSTIFAPYFVVGALYSGIATIIVVLALFRRVYNLGSIIKPRHFRALGTLTLVSGVTYAYFTLSEYVTIGYKLREGDQALLQTLLSGKYAPIFWTVMIPGTVVPVILLSLKRTRTVRWIVVAALLVNLGMWLKRFIIVVPSLALPLMPAEWGIYRPTGVEWFITAASFAGFALLLFLFSRLFPIVSLWEIEEHAEHETEPDEAPVVLEPVGAAR